MEENPFQTPRANLIMQGQRLNRPVISVFVAFLVYYGFKLTAHAGLTELLVFFVKTKQMDSAQVNLFVAEYKIVEVFKVLGYAIECFAALLAGYVCAYIAHDYVAKPVGVLILLFVFVGTLAQMLKAQELLAFYLPFLYLIPMIMFGAWLFVRFKKPVLEIHYEELGERD
jgi:hypothetical protein